MFKDTTVNETKNYVPIKEASKIVNKITEDNDSEITCSMCEVDHRYSFPVYRKEITSAHNNL